MKYVPSPFGPLLTGAVLLVVVLVFLTWVRDFGAADGKAAFFPLILVALPTIPLVIGLYMIGPRRRYVAATTPDERRMHKQSR